MLNLKKMDEVLNKESVITDGVWSFNTNTGLLTGYSKNEWCRKQIYRFLKALEECGAKPVEKDGYFKGVIIAEKEFKPVCKMWNSYMDKKTASFGDKQ